MLARAAPGGGDPARRVVSGIKLSAGPLVDLFLAEVSGDVQAGDGACLSEQERERAARFRFTRDRDRYVRTHALLRRMLGEQNGIAPQAIRFESNAWGKPRALVPERVRFNISYADGFVLLGFSRCCEIGVDLERLRTIEGADELAELHFTASERSYLECQPLGLRDRAFLRGWTRKEACIKAVGAGLSLPTSEFESGLEPEPRRLRVRAQGQQVHLEVHSLQIGSELIGAWARLL